MSESNMQTATHFCGIDPGQSGALALVCPDGQVRVWEMPWSRAVHQRPEIDQRAFKDLMKVLIPIKDSLIIAIEDVWARPVKNEKTGKPINSNPASHFKLGYALAAIQVPLEMVGLELNWMTPQSWQKTLGLRSNSSHQKHAELLYPGVQIQRKDQASALLIATAAKMKHESS